MKPICVPCQRFYRPEKNGIAFIEQMPTGNKVPPGTAAPELWKPYKLWRGDLWRCHGCGGTIIVGSGHTPWREHYMGDFEAEVAALGATIKVNDC